MGSFIKIGQSCKSLFNLIGTTKAKGVVFITGDQHYVEILRIQEALNYEAYEIMAAGINQTEKPGRANKQVAGPDLSRHSASMLYIH